MENAAKALLIAAGVLFAIIVLGLFMILSNNLSVMGEAEEQKRAAEQLRAFNAEYEAYNKKVMYGTEVITIVNKAIENNRRYDNDPAHYSYIDITIKTAQDFITTEGIVEMLPGGTQKKTPETTMVNLKVDTYKYSRDKKLRDFFQLPLNEERETRNKKTYYTDSALTAFKRVIFMCVGENGEQGEGVHYNEQTGRIDSITFVQRDPSTY